MWIQGLLETMVASNHMDLALLADHRLRITID